MKLKKDKNVGYVVCFYYKDPKGGIFICVRHRYQKPIEYDYFAQRNAIYIGSSTTYMQVYYMYVFCAQFI